MPTPECRKVIGYKRFYSYQPTPVTVFCPLLEIIFRFWLNGRKSRHQLQTSTGSAESPFQTPKMAVVYAGFAVRAASPPTPSLPFGIPDKERDRKIGEWAFDPEAGHQPGNPT
jgi:hypothetical protein